jgi:cytochrome P450
MESTEGCRFDGSLARPPCFYRQWMVAGNPAAFFDHLARRFGDFVHYRGLFKFYLINHPSLVKQLLQETHKSFDKKTVIYNRFRTAFGNGLVVSEDDHWKRQRKLIQPMFGHSSIARFFPHMVDATAEMINRWELKCRAGRVFDVAGEMNRITLEIVGRTLFHDSFGQAADDIQRWTHTIDRYSAKAPIPIIRDSWFPSRRNRRLKKTLQEFHSFLLRMIEARRGGGDRDDLLTRFLNVRNPDTGQAMTDAEIVDEALGMVIGGHETSASALTWVWYELDRNPDIRERVHAEVDRVIAQRPLTIDLVGQLVYTKMVIDETLRLHPPFWFENRNVKESLELGGHRLPRGSIVAFSRYSLHRHPRFWREPDRFDPERFQPDHEENQRSSCAYVPFGGGPPICIGIHFATIELLVIVAMITRQYRLVTALENRHEMSAALTMTPRYGHLVRLEQR